MSGILEGIAIAEVFGWIWKQFGKDIVSSSAKTLKMPWDKFNLQRAAQRYAEGMQKDYGFIRILDMTAPVSLEGLFTQVNVLSTPSAFRRGRLKQLEDIFLGKSTYGEVIEKGKDALEVVKKHKRLFILGKPGAGKTTLLKYLVLQALKGELDGIPIFIPLRWFADTETSLFDYITQQFDICDFPEAAPFIESILKNGKAIVLCDGLDEVNTQEGARDRVIRELVTFSRKYKNSQVLITCRVAASEYQFEAFTPVEMADFEKDQIHTFITNWFTHTQSGDAIANRLELKSSQKLAEQFLKEFEQSRNPRLYDLARTPLILTLLCLAYEETLEFPDRRSEIYEEAFNTLLRKWDSKRNIKRDAIYHKLTLGRKRQMFARIAAETFEKNEYLFQQKHLQQKIVSYLQNLPPADSHEDIDGEAVLKAIEAQHGVFVERSKGYYSFSHLTFQEYFTARYIVEHIHERTLKRLIHSHCTDDNWREVFLLTSEMLDDADKFVEIFLAKLDKMVRADERLRQLLTRVEQEAAALQSEAKPFEKRWAMLSLMLDTAVRLARARALDRVSDRAYTLAHTLDRASYLARTLARSLTLDHDLTRSLTLASDLAGILASAYAHVRVRDLARALALARNFDLVKEMSKELGFTELYKRLKSISVPAADAAPEAWIAFSQTLLDIFQAHFPLEEYTFTPKQTAHVEAYMKATYLLQDCLKNAYVSDREAIMERLLRVPTARDRE